MIKIIGKYGGLHHVWHLLNYLQDLHSIGARNFMVFNMAPIGCYPAFLVELPHSSNDLDENGCMTNYNSAVVYYNELLNNSLAEVRKTLQSASIVYVDKYSVMLELFRHPEDHGELSLQSFFCHPTST